MFLIKVSILYIYGIVSVWYINIIKKCKHTFLNIKWAFNENAPLNTLLWPQRRKETSAESTLYLEVVNNIVSCKYKINKIGPETEPWGTLILMSNKCFKLIVVLILRVK